MSDEYLHARIEDILKKKIMMGAGYGTKAGAKKALKTKRKKGLIGKKKRVGKKTKNPYILFMSKPANKKKWPDLASRRKAYHKQK